MQILGLIPARGGSKGIPGKNLKPLGGRPLIDYTFAAVLGSRRLTRTILSTDSPEIAAAGRAAGIEVPFMRPAELAGDTTPTLAVVRHALDWLQGQEGRAPEVVVMLQATAPLRRSRHVDEAIELLLSSGADSVVGVMEVPLHYNAHWQMVLVEGGLRLADGADLSRIIGRRQDLPATYCRNGALYAFRSRALEETGSFYGRRSLPYVMPAALSINIDGPEDWLLAEAALMGSAGMKGSAGDPP